MDPPEKAFVTSDHPKNEERGGNEEEDTVTTSSPTSDSTQECMQGLISDVGNLTKDMEKMKETTTEMRKEREEDKKILVMLLEGLQSEHGENPDFKEMLNLVKKLSDYEKFRKLEEIAKKYDEIESKFDHTEKKNEQLEERLKEKDAKLDEMEKVNMDLNERLKEKGIAKADWLEVAQWVITLGREGAAIAAFLIKCATKKVALEDGDVAGVVGCGGV